MWGFWRLTAFAALSKLAAAVTSQTRQLAVFLPGIAYNVGNITALTDVFAARISKAIDAPLETVKFTGLYPDSANLAGSFLTFALIAPFDPPVSSSLDPGYDTVATTWMNALKQNDELKKEFTFLNRQQTLDPARYEALVYDKFESDNSFIEGEDPAVPAGTERNELLVSLLSRKQVLQVRLPQLAFATLNQNPELLLETVDGLRTVGSKVLAVPESRVVFYDIRNAKPGVAVQFSVYPSSNEELEQAQEKWKMAVSNSEAVIQEAFPGYDPLYQPIAEAELPTGNWEIPEVEADDDSITGVVAGAVIGGVAAVAAIGGAGGYWFKKRRSSDGLADDDELLEYHHDVREMDFVEDTTTPGAGLSNVDIGATPTHVGPNNYRAH